MVLLRLKISESGLERVLEGVNFFDFGTSAGFEPAPGLPGRHLGEVGPKTQKTTVEHGDLWG